MQQLIRPRSPLALGFPLRQFKQPCRLCGAVLLKLGVPLLFQVARAGPGRERIFGSGQKEILPAAEAGYHPGPRDSRLIPEAELVGLLSKGRELFGKGVVELGSRGGIVVGRGGPRDSREEHEKAQRGFAVLGQSPSRL